jgi:dihydrofolate synthase/folylpolyglutamate synthase
LLERIDTWIAVALSGPRALTDVALAERLSSAGAQTIITAVSVETGCELVRLLAQPQDRVIVFGSFLTVGAALQWARLM